MTSIINKYFKRDTKSEQELFNRIKMEAIQVQGRSYYYIPRKIEVIDLILGEDVLSKFDQAFELEMYMEDVNGFSGEKEIFSKFGLEIHNNYKLVVSQDRWISEVGKKALGTIITNRPQEGDLIYDPMTKFLMEIKFVDHDAEFYQLGKNYLWHLSCESFQYSSEDFSTGISDIDSIDNGNSFDRLEKQILSEDGIPLEFDNCENLISDNADKNQTTLDYDKAPNFNDSAKKIEFDINNPFAGI
jgi:hypothetical protein